MCQSRKLKSFHVSISIPYHVDHILFICRQFLFSHVSIIE